MKLLAAFKTRQYLSSKPNQVENKVIESPAIYVKWLTYCLKKKKYERISFLEFFHTKKNSV